MAKKLGRPKKRGPKKKKAKKVRTTWNTWDYKIISCRNGRQNGYYGKFLSAKDAYRKIDELLEDCKDVVFPKKVLNSHGLNTSVDEYLILVRNRGDNEIPMLRNDYGKLVEHRTNSEKWTIVDKFRYYVEETFWVYGYDPSSDRKTFMWILENLIVGKIQSKYDMKRICLYKNKIIIKDDSNEMDMVLCKNKSEAIRFYNLLREKINGTLKEVVFMGEFGGAGKRTTNLVNDICNYTGWNRNKVTRHTTNV